jgi:hypothetical protein
MRLGAVARMDEEWLHFETFRRLYRETMVRRSAAPRYFFSDGYFDALREGLGDRLHLCIVEMGGVIAAAGLFVETCGIVQVHLSGSDDALSNIAPMKVMLHYVEGWAKARGDRHLHLGGGVGGQNDSLQYFKAGFSPLRHPFSTLRVVVDRQEYRRLVAALDPLLDEDDRSGFFPLYRQA